MKLFSKTGQWLTKKRWFCSGSETTREANIRDCSGNKLWDGYFQRAEKDIEAQWTNIIWPLISDFNFATTLELAPGAGRNTEKLAALATTLHAVDLNQGALDQVKQRFENRTIKAQLILHRNTGCDLSMIESGSVTAFYCWDAAVHFDKEVIKMYVAEIARVLASGGKGFLHHSNLGTQADSAIRRNPHWRSNMSKELFQEFCAMHGIVLVKQHDLNWGEITDCISIFSKP